MFSKRLLLSALAFTFFGFACQSLYASQQAAQASTSTSTAEEFMRLFNDRDRYRSSDDRIMSLSVKICELKKYTAHAKPLPAGVTMDRVEEKITEYEARYAALLFGGSNTGALIAKGLVTGDKNSFTRALDDMDITSWYDGIGKGMLLQVANAGGNFVGEKTKGMFDALGGGLVDMCVAKIRNIFVELNSRLFHDGMKPFEKLKLEAWANVILDSLANIGEMVEKGQGFGMRAMDMTSRQSDDLAEAQSSPSDQGKILDAWVEFSSIHAEEYKFCIEQMQKTKEYYEDADETDIVIFYVDKICQMLAVMYRLLKESESFKDFNNKLSSNKLMIKAMHGYLANYFKHLIREVYVRAGGKDVNANSPSGSSSSYRGLGGGYDSSFSPGSYSSSQQLF